MLQSGLGSIQRSTKGRLPLMVIFHWRSSSTEDHLPLKNFLHQRLSSNEGRLPQKVVIQQRLPSPEGLLPLKVVFPWGSSSSEVRLPQKIILPHSLKTNIRIFSLSIMSLTAQYPLNQSYVGKLSFIRLGSKVFSFERFVLIPLSPISSLWGKSWWYCVDERNYDQNLDGVMLRLVTNKHN